MLIPLSTAYRSISTSSSAVKSRLDSASTFCSSWLTLLAPISATVGIFAFLQSWNDFMMPNLITANPKWQTLPVVQYLFQDQFTTNINIAFASYLMALLPTLVLSLIHI